MGPLQGVLFDAVDKLAVGRVVGIVLQVFVEVLLGLGVALLVEVVVAEVVVEFLGVAGIALCILTGFY